MADSLLFPMVTNCKLTINKVFLKDRKLYKLIADKHHFKIISFDPLVIEKDNLSQKDILELFDALQVYSENPETKHDMLNKEVCASINDVTSNSKVEVTDTSMSLLLGTPDEFYSIKDESCNNQIDEIQLGSVHRKLITEEQDQKMSDNKEFTNFKHKINLDNNDVNLMADTGRSEQERGRCKNNMQEIVQTLSEQHISQNTTENSKSDEKSQEMYRYSMKAPSFHVAMWYFMKSCFRCYFEQVETDGAIFTFKLNPYVEEDVKFLNKIKQLEFEKYEFVNEDRDYVMVALETVMSEVSLLTLDVIGDSIHIIGSKEAVASACKKLDSLLVDQGSNTRLSSEHLHKKDESLEEAKPWCYRYSDRQEKDISGNENTHKVVKSREPQYSFIHSASKTPEFKRSASDQDYNLPSSHERYNDSKTSDFKLTHSENNTFSVYSHTQSDHCIVSKICKLKVKIYKANIVQIKADCIVNNTNKFLINFGGVAKAIEEAAGAALRQECESFINAGHVIEVTNIFLSAGGNLPAKYVMHTVGPDWNMYEENKKSKCLDDLRHTVMRCLFEADKRGLTSVALPSISAGICGVPKKLCAKCYMDAVKHFDAIIARGDTSLREIHFVDVNDDLVALIRECFSSNLSRSCDEEILLKDRDFVKNHNYSASQIETASQVEKTTYHLKFDEKNKFLDYHWPSSLTRVKKEMVVSAPFKAENYEMSATYNLGRVTLKVDGRCALDQRSDMILAVGKHFDNLSSIPDFRISSHLKQSKVLGKDENIYKFFNVSDSNGVQSHLLCEVYPEPENADKIKEALKNVESAINLQNIKELVLTSSFLYADSTNKELQKRNMSIIDRKKVGKFAQCLYSYLEKVNNEIQNNICVTVTGSEDALLTIKKVIESYNVQKTVSEGESYNVQKTVSESESYNVQKTVSEDESYNVQKTVSASGSYNVQRTVSEGESYNVQKTISEEAAVHSSSTKATLSKFSVNSDMNYETSMSVIDVNTPMNPGNLCEFCCEKTLCLPVICCRKLFCLKCKQIASSCPFCNTFWGILTGNQPQGFMKVSLINDHADGYEHANVWKIDYYFPSGRQEKCHPNPGKMYDSVTRTGYLPANLHGLQVLMLLRISFIRKLTFTIGHSLKRNRDDVIIWNDISHKTGLHGEEYGYPDPNYLNQVTVELSNKGVRLDTLTETEKHQLAEFRSSITNFKRFSDNNPL